MEDVFIYLLMDNGYAVFHIRKYIIKTHDSELQGQEEAGCTRRTSKLFTRSTALKFVKALNKPPLKLLLSYQRFSMF